MFLVLGIIGLGSVALHSTLHWLWQSADEVPMLWQNLTFLFSLIQISSTNKTRALQVGFGIIVIGAIQTYMYYSMRHLYWAFLCQYISMVVVVVVWTSILVFSSTSLPQEKQVRLWLFSRSLTSYVVIASVLWIYEMNNCELLLPHYTRWYGLSFHILWHVGAGLGTYLEILLLCAVRAQNQGLVVEVTWKPFLVVPVLAVTGTKATAEMKKK